MKILAIDSTGVAASVAVVSEDKTIANFTINNKLNHSKVLMPMLDNMLGFCNLTLDDMDYIGVSSGPGSFTGLRIGAATAKGIAHIKKIKIVSVSTLEALAYNVYDEEKIIVPLIDSRRNEAYTQFFKFNGKVLKPLTDIMCLSINDIVEKLKAYDEKIIFNGDGVKILPQLDKAKFIVAPEYLQIQSASTVGHVALNHVSNNVNIFDYLTFEPFYLKKSQAEREYEEKNYDKNNANDN